MGFQCPATIWVKNFFPISNLNLPWLTSWPFPKSCHWSRRWTDLLLQKRWLSDPASQRDIRHWATWDLKSYTYHQMSLCGGPCHSWCSESSSYQGMSSETWPDQPWASLTNWDWGWGCLCTLLHQLLSLSTAPVSSSQTSQSGAWFLGCRHLTLPLPVEWPLWSRASPHALFSCCGCLHSLGAIFHSHGYGYTAF